MEFPAEIQSLIHDFARPVVVTPKTIADIPFGEPKNTVYYCANIIEKRWKCDNQLLYVKGGGFGMNYKYCAKCYGKWNRKEKPDEKINRNICLVKW